VFIYNIIGLAIAGRTIPEREGRSLDLVKWSNAGKPRGATIGAPGKIAFSDDLLRIEVDAVFPTPICLVLALIFWLPLSP
jgi:hypothetical protein